MRLSLLLFCFSVWATLLPAQQIKLTIELENCSITDSVVIFKFEGMGMQPVHILKAKTDDRGKYTIDLPFESSPKFYYASVNIGESPRVKAFLLHNEPQVTIVGPCFDITQAQVKGSKLNLAYDGMVKRNNDLKIVLNQLIFEWRGANGDPARISDIEGRMKKNDDEKRNFLDSMRRVNPYLADVLAIDTYFSYQGSADKTKYKDEIDYFGTAYFQNANLADANYNEVPLLYDMFVNFADVMQMVGLPDAEQRRYIDAHLAKFAKGSKAQKVALAGVATTLLNKKTPIGVYYAERLVTEFGATDPSGTARLTSQIAKLKSEMTGQTAPEIVMDDVNGKSLPLSSLKGQVVLLDFWASWCGPCRRENPNVVAMYNKYKDKGFTVYSVSLDSKKDSWLAAIQADGLVWNNHVSDLLGWQNAAAKQYGISSIPQTLLLDRQGNIVAKNLRGDALGQKLQEILGN